MSQDQFRRRAIKLHKKNQNIALKLNNLYTNFIDQLKINMPIDRESFEKNRHTEETYKFTMRHFSEIRQKYPVKFESNVLLEDITNIAKIDILFRVLNSKYAYKEKKSKDKPDYFKFFIDQEYEKEVKPQQRIQSEKEWDTKGINNQNNDNWENINDDWGDNKKGETNRMNNIVIQFKGWGEDKIKYTDSEKR